MPDVYKHSVTSRSIFYVILTTTYSFVKSTRQSYIFISVINHSNKFNDCLHLKERNKSVYGQYKRILRYFNTATYFSSVNAWAVLASLFYKCDRNRECLHILNYSLSKCTTDKILISLSNNIEEQTVLQKLNQTLGLSLTCKYLIIGDVNMKKTFHLLPTELAPLISEKIDAVTSFPPVVYLNVLNYFCLHHLEDCSSKMVALRDLELTVREKYFIIENKEQLTTANQCIDIAKNMI